MKKYNKPQAKVVIIDECEFICTSPIVHDEEGNGVQLSKDRSNVNFADEESLF